MCPDKGWSCPTGEVIQLPPRMWARVVKIASFKRDTGNTDFNFKMLQLICLKTKRNINQNLVKDKQYTCEDNPNNQSSLRKVKRI